ncbi:GatB/YqeY domain-containing protein [Lactarius hengduanensis]|nr:GatB/YqeY domain-containing protein [Lactarius hengduanensis]
MLDQRFSRLYNNPCTYSGLGLTHGLRRSSCMPFNRFQSVLSEVYSADKVLNGKKIDSSGIALLIRKAYARRLDSAVQFNQASRPDLAGKEQQEADLLARFLPPLLPEAEVDRILQGVMTEQVSKAQDDPRKSIGRIFKAFYAKVDRASVDPDLLKRRTEALLSS